MNKIKRANELCKIINDALRELQDDLDMPVVSLEDVGESIDWFHVSDNEKYVAYEPINQDMDVDTRDAIEIQLEEHPEDFYDMNEIPCDVRF